MSHVDHGVDGVVGYRICLTHRRSSVRAWVDSYFLIKPTSVHMLPPFRKSVPTSSSSCDSVHLLDGYLPMISTHQFCKAVQWEYFVSHEFLPVKFSFIKLANRWVDLPIGQTLAIKSRVQFVAKTIRMVPVKILAGAFTEAFIATYSFNPQTASLTVMSRQPTGGNCSWIFQHPTNGRVL